MFTSRLVTVGFVLVFAIVNVMAAPVPASSKYRLGLAAAKPRDAAPFETIPAYMKRDVLESRQTDIPDDVAVKSDGITVSLFAPGEQKRDGVLESRQTDIPDDVAVKSDGITVSLFAPGEEKRDRVWESRQTDIPDDVAVKSDGITVSLFAPGEQ